MADEIEMDRFVEDGLDPDMVRLIGADGAPIMDDGADDVAVDD